MSLPSLGRRYFIGKKPASSSSSREVEPFWVLVVPKRSGPMWLGDTASPASSDHKLPWSLTWVEQLLSLDFPFALSGTSSSGSPAAPRACRRAACCAPAAKGTALGQAGCLLRGEGPGCAESHGQGSWVDATGCLCCVSARTSLQPCLEMPRARLAAYSAVKRLSCCYKIHGHGSWKVFVPERPCWVLLSFLGAALCSPVLLSHFMSPPFSSVQTYQAHHLDLMAKRCTYTGPRSASNPHPSSRLTSSRSS